MDTAQVVARFEAERQALAVMSHPAIAQVFDAGATPQGRPYFVMEYVRGEAITSYCDQHRLSTRQRIDLFLQVCEGVHHAHQKGIIHRDLKPSNILVTVRDDIPVPKIIDFGLAKATTHLLTDRTLVTEFGMLVGTPEYMSPEQSDPASLDIDTRTDVYSLGVILYELLTGILPFDAKALRERGLDELRRAIRETDPPRPSTRVSTVADPARWWRAGAWHRRTWRASFEGTSIGSRCVPSNATARAVTDRFRTWPPICSGTFKTSLSWPALPERSIAQASSCDAIESASRSLASSSLCSLRSRRRRPFRRGASPSERDRANREAGVANAVNEFLQNDLLAQAGASAQARPDTKPDPDLKVRTALDRAAANIERRFETQPLVEASIRTTIGKTYEDLGLYPEAASHLTRALELTRRELGEQDVRYLSSVSDLAELHLKEAKYEQAVQLLTGSLEAARVLGDQHPQTLTIMTGLGQVYMMQGKHSEAEALYVQALEGRRRLLGDEHTGTLETMGALASLYWRQGKYAQAEPIRAEVVRLQRRLLGEEHPATLTSLNNLALLASYQGRYAEAETQFVSLIATMRRVLGDDHLETMISAGNLGIVYLRQGRLAEAEAVFAKVLEQKQRVLGDKHPETLTSMNNLGVVYRAEGKYPEAERLYGKVMEVQRAVLGDNHPNSWVTMNGLAFLYMVQGKNAQAERLYTEALAGLRRLLGEEHPETLNTTHNLAVFYVNEGRNAEAEPLGKKAVEIRRRVLGPEHPETLRSVSNLGLLYLNVGRYDEAESLLRNALSAYEKSVPDGWERYHARSMLGASVAGQKRYQEAEPLAVEAYEALIQRKASVPPANASVVDQAGQRVMKLYRDWRKPEKVTEWAKRLSSAAVKTPSRASDQHKR